MVGADRPSHRDGAAGVGCPWRTASDRRLVSGPSAATWVRVGPSSLCSPGRSLVAVALVIGVIVALRQQRKRLALAMVVSPLLGITIVRLCQAFFGREKEGALAYPSGHTTFLVTVTGLLMLVACMRLWALAIAVCVVLLGTLRPLDDLPLLHRHRRRGVAGNLACVHFRDRGPPGRLRRARSGQSGLR